MFLQKLNLVNFKNYEQGELAFTDKINCFIGDNGVGKTNILDAIYYLSLTKSYFNTIDTQNIKHGNDFLVIQGEYLINGRKENIYCGIKKSKRKHFKRNQKEYEKLSDHIGLIPVVMISPADSILISGGSEERRKFINAVISQYDHIYLNESIQYNKALIQRNALLKEIAKNKGDESTLEIWDDKLVLYGEKIFTKRKEFIQKFSPIFQEYYDFISEKKETIELVYQSQLSDGNFKEQLRAAKTKDLILQYTTVGVHKDDLLMKISGYPIRKTGSQGQQKTFLVALKFAKFDFIKKTNNQKPILLLDDIFDKFDAHRVKQIINLVGDENFGQIFITDTNYEKMKSILENTSFNYKIVAIKDNSFNIE